MYQRIKHELKFIIFILFILLPLILMIFNILPGEELTEEQPLNNCIKPYCV